ncbi:hypothetical protein LXL04_037161 [Taraxacum kok-saghyz]
MKKVPSQSSMVEQSADNMEDLVCDKDKAEVDKSEHDCGKSGTKVTEMEVYQDNGPSLKYDGSKTAMVEDVADNIEDHECDEDIIGGSNVKEDVIENPVADMNEMQDTEIRDLVVIMRLHTSAYVLAAEQDMVMMAYGFERIGIQSFGEELPINNRYLIRAGYGNDAYGDERTGVFMHRLLSPATDLKEYGNDASGRRYSKSTRLRHTPLANNFLEERILLNQKVKQWYELVYALMKLRVLVEEQLETELKGMKEK